MRAGGGAYFGEGADEDVCRPQNEVSEAERPTKCAKHKSHEVCVLHDDYQFAHLDVAGLVLN